MKYVEYREESLQQIVLIPREESLQQIVSGICYHNSILQNLSEQDACFDSKDLIDRERNALDLYDQRDRKKSTVAQCSGSIQPSKLSYLMQTILCYRISQLTQLTSPERFDQMKYVEQREESLKQIVSIPREESVQQIV